MHEVIVFCHRSDQVADSLIRQLETPGRSVLMVTAEELSFAQWKHTIDAAGKCKTQIILPNGKLIHSDKVTACFNRIRFITMLQFADETDRNYAEMEIFALYVSFLKGINHLLINPVQTSSLTFEEGNEWLLKKQLVDAGLPVTDRHFTSSPKWRSTPGLIPLTPRKDHVSSYKKSLNLLWENKPVLLKEAFNKTSTITVAGEAIFGDYPANFRDATGRFSKITGMYFFELLLVHTVEGFKIDGVNTFPVYADLKVVKALTSLIERKLESRL